MWCDGGSPFGRAYCFEESRNDGVARHGTSQLLFEDEHEMIERNHYVLHSPVLLAINKSVANSDIM